MAITKRRAQKRTTDPVSYTHLDVYKRQAKGQPVVQFLSLAKDESIATVLDLTNIPGKHLFLISKAAVVKRIDIEDIANIRSSGLIVMKPHDGDALGWVRVTDGTDNILLVSR